MDGYKFKYYDDVLEDKLRESICLWDNEIFNKKDNIFVPDHGYTIIEEVLAANSKEVMVKWINNLNLALCRKICWKNANYCKSIKMRRFNYNAQLSVLQE